MADCACTYCNDSGLIRVAGDGGQHDDFPCPACKPEEHDEALRLAYDENAPFAPGDPPVR